MDESILTSIKKLIGITEECTDFDTDVSIHINTAFSTLNQLGAGPEDGFFIFDKTLKWSDYSDNKKLLGFIKQYIYIKTKTVFDPPSSTSLSDALKRTADELEERIKLEVELSGNYTSSSYNVGQYADILGGESILTSIKKLLGITEEYNIFDMDVIIHINSGFSTLNQIGAGPLTGFYISDETTTWGEFTNNSKLLGFVKQYLYIKVRNVFDPPSSSSVLNAYKVVAEELGERIKIECESSTVIDPNGIIPSGTYWITENGVHDITTYAYVNVDVPIPEGYLFPEGTLDITENGLHDIPSYQSVNVNVPIPEGYLVPEGTFETIIEGTYDVTPYASATFTIQKEQVSVTPTEEAQTLTPSENKYFSEVVVNPIPSEYIIPSGSVDITNTEEVDVTQYAKAQIKDENLKAENIAENVEVLGITGTFRGGIDTSDADATSNDILLGKSAYVKEQKVVGTIETYDGSASEDVTPMEDDIVSGKTIDTYTNNRITKVGDYKFKGGYIRVFNSTSATFLGAQTFYATNIEECNTPNLTRLTSGSSFGGCTSLKKGYFPKLGSTFGAGNFSGCTSLLYAHIGKVSRVGQSSFQSCSSLKAIIIESSSVPTLDNVNAFSSSGISKGTGFIYVLDTMVEKFKVATNWSTYATQFKPKSELPQEVKDAFGIN